MSLHIRKADNGFIVEVTKPSRVDSSIGATNTHVFETGDSLLAFVTQHLIDPCVGVPVAESPQDTDSTETVEVEAREEYDEFAKTVWKGPEPVEPMADLSGEPWPKFPGSEEIDWGAPNGGLDQVDARTVFEPKS